MDITSGDCMALKIIRNNEQMYASEDCFFKLVRFQIGQKEIGILHKIKANDPDGSKFCIKILQEFLLNSHLCE